MKKNSIIVLCLILLTIIGCSQKGKEIQEDKEKKKLKWAIDADPKTLDPQLNSSTGAGSIINNMYEGLMRNVDGKLEPAMATSYEVSKDNLTYTFKLRDTKWSDGKSVTANDFKYSWLRALDPKTASEYAFQLFYIKGARDYYEGVSSKDSVGITIIDDRTLVVELIDPTPYFLNLTAFYTYFPVREDAVRKDPDSWAFNPKEAISNGPFKLSKYSQGEEIVLEKNDKYWNAKNVKLDEIEAIIITDSMTALTAYEQDEVAILDTLPDQEISRLKMEEPTFKVLPMLGTYYYIFNVEKEPTNNKDVRKALSLAIDRGAIVKGIKKGGEIGATGFVPEGLLDSSGNNFREVAGDYYIDKKASVDKAKKLLARAGYPNGKGFPKLTLLYNTSDSHKAIAEAIQEMWKKNLGIQVELMNQEWAVFKNTIAVGEFQVGRASWIGDYVDPMTFLELWTSYSRKNNARWIWTEDGKNPNNKIYDELVVESKISTGKARDEKLYELEKLMMEEVIVAPIYYYVDQVMVKSYVEGWDKSVLDTWYFGNTKIKK